MTNIYRYVLMGDGGMAPNPRDGLLTLATCKPQIRNTAQTGDWVIGNFPSPRNELVAWAGRIANCIPVGLYSSEFPERDDALHDMGPDGEPQRIAGKHDWYHQRPAEQRKDRSGNVLVFDMESCWYFGGAGRQFPPELEHLVARGQGHRVNKCEPGDLEQLQCWLREQGAPGIIGEPRDGWDGPDDEPPRPCGSRKRRKPKKPKGSC